jgi:hypothetical protein
MRDPYQVFTKLTPFSLGIIGDLYQLLMFIR